MPPHSADDAAPRDALKKAASIAAGFVALLHVWFFVLETFLWRSSFAMKSLQMSAADAEATAILAGNQGVYNLVFAVGLGFGVLKKNPAFVRFFLISIIGVGIYGAVSARWTILFLQVLPAAIALGLELTSPSNRK